MANKDNKITAGGLAFPFALLTLTVVIILGYQLKQVLHERSNLKTTKTAQTEQLEQVEPVRKQLDALASGLLDLSKKGNKNADIAIDAMKKLGVAINPNTDAPATETKASAKPADDKK